MSSTLDLAGAAALLHMHEHTVEAMARAGRIPAAKPGKRWVFVEADLLDWLRSKYREGTECRSTSGAPSGGVGGRSAAKRLGNLLALPTEKRRRNTTTAAAPTSGAPKSSASVVSIGTRPRSSG